jgi:hypothetical protein
MNRYIVDALIANGNATIDDFVPNHFWYADPIFGGYLVENYEWKEVKDEASDADIPHDCEEKDG